MNADARRPVLLVFAGKAGSGKTTVAKMVARTTHFAFFDYDTLVQPFLEEIENRFGLGDSSRLDFYRRWRKQSYRTLFNPVVENLRLGTDVILCAPLSEELQDPGFPDVLRTEVGVPFSLFLCHLRPPLDIHYHMIMDRNSRRDEDLLSDRAKFFDVCKAMDSVWDVPSLVLESGDSKKNYEIVMERIHTL